MKDEPINTKKDEDDLTNVLAASVNLIHKNLLKDPEGEDYEAFVNAILEASCLVTLDEVSTALHHLEDAIEKLHRTPLLPNDTRLGLLHIAQTINVNPALRNLRERTDK
jgi:hypothetical protein